MHIVLHIMLHIVQIAYLAYWLHIVHINLHIILHISWHILLHISSYYFTYISIYNVMHISHIIWMVSYFAYFAYFAFAWFHILFCNFLSKKINCHIKHQKLKLPDVGDIINYAFPLHMDIWGYPSCESNRRPQTCYPQALPTRAIVLWNCA